MPGTGPETGPKADPTCPGPGGGPGDGPGGGAAARPDASVLIEMIFPEQTNHYGTLFGGNGLALMAKAGFVTASRFARRNVVLAASRDVGFVSPVRLGEVLELTGRITRTGRSSMTVHVEGVAEALTSGARRPAMRALFEMVAVDDRGRPVPIKENQNVSA